MRLTWDREAEEILRRVPFFVRHRVRKKVEEEVAARGRQRITVADIEESKKRHLQTHSKDVKGYSIETCFGSSGCSNAVTASAALVNELDKVLQQAELLSFLRLQLGDRLKLHHQFRVTVADCPNCCSQPQIKDVGIIGQAGMEIRPEECLACGDCEAACEEAAILLAEGSLLGLDEDRCVRCAACARACPTDAITCNTAGYRLLVGGKLGRHPQLAVELARDLSEEQVLQLVARITEFFKANALEGERLGALLNRYGWNNFKAAVL
ncbi:MAG: 4Fe-4S binding protein [Deltaproteobacteria bacterium]|nr:4Fe-4S binding protein [Deltaproteobacteria bacterium]